MNLFSALEELDKLYESVEKQEEVSEQDATEKAVEEAAIDLTEAAEDEEIEIVEDDAVEEASAEDEAAQQFVLECDNCGGLIVKIETDVTIDEETDLANVGDVCQYCEASNGYKLLGTLMPYETEEVEPETEQEAEQEEAVVEDTAEEDEIVEESLLDLNMPIDVDIAANGNDVAVGGLA